MMSNFKRDMINNLKHNSKMRTKHKSIVDYIGICDLDRSALGDRLVKIIESEEPTYRDSVLHEHLYGVDNLREEVDDTELCSLMDNINLIHPNAAYVRIIN